MITPGPWIAKQLVGTTERGHVILRIEGPRTFRIDSSGEFSADDAKLIAAAPELLKTLRAAVEALDSITASLPDAASLADPAIDAAQAAIAKATKDS